MQTYIKKHFSHSCKITLLFFFAVYGNLFSQSKASDWLKYGLESSSVETKIQAFNKAIQINPDYIEAYYYLGLAYQAKGMVEKAEISFNKAYFKNPYNMDADLKTSILFELGKIYASEGKIEKARDALQGAKELTDKKSRGQICLELGKIYLQEGNIDKALNELYEGQRLLPQNFKLFSDIISSAENKKVLTKKYKKSISLLISERYDEAIKLLTEIKNINPDFKDVEQKLLEAQTALQQKNRIRKLISLYNLASQKALSGEYSEAVTLFKQITELEPNFKNSQSRLEELQTFLVEEVRIEEFYKDGLRAFQKRNWEQALNDFDHVIRVNNEYKDVQSLIQRAKNRLSIQNENSKSSVSSSMAGTDSSELKNKQSESKSSEKLNTFARNESSLEDKHATKESRKSDSTLTVTDIQTIYQNGLFALQNGDWQEAVLAFEKVDLLDPEFADIQNKLADARFNLNKSYGISEPTSSSYGIGTKFVIFSTLSIILMPLLGFIFMAPASRAKIYFMQRKYKKSAEIYEKMLKKNPGKIKLYPLLANIYLLQNRRDEAALLVFEKIMNLNIYTDKKKEINSILANQYLIQGRTDNNAIQIMERELGTKTSKLNNS